MRQLATIQKIADIRPIEGADKIEVAQVLGWECVVPKGEFKPGDRVVYFEIDSLIPYAKWSAFLWKGKIPDNPSEAKHRLRSQKIRGVVSQGLVQPLRILNPKSMCCSFDGKKIYEYPEYSEGLDVTKQLSIEKYEKGYDRTPKERKPKSLFVRPWWRILGYFGIKPKRKYSGGRQFPAFLHKTDETRIQSVPRVLDELRGKEIYITEKLDGTSVTFYCKDGKFGVCSRNLELNETPDNVYWEMAKQYKIQEVLSRYDNICLQGEIVGEGIQKNPLKLKGKDLYIYNLYFLPQKDRNVYGEYACFDTLKTFCATNDLKMVPIVQEDEIIRESWTVPFLVDLANGRSVVNPDVKREGIVIRTTTEMRSSVLKGRASFKAISNEYLLSHGE